LFNTHDKWRLIASWCRHFWKKLFIFLENSWFSKKPFNKSGKSFGFRQNWLIFIFKPNFRFWILHQFYWYLWFSLNRCGPVFDLGSVFQSLLIGPRKFTLYEFEIGELEHQGVSPPSGHGQRQVGGDCNLGQLLTTGASPWWTPSPPCLLCNHSPTNTSVSCQVIRMRETHSPSRACLQCHLDFSARWKKSQSNIESASRPLVDFGVLNDNLIKCLISFVEVH
jgi:hypothetical protein